MFQNRGTKGKDLINRSTSVFKDIVEDLNEGSEHCRKEIDRHNEIINESSAEIITLNDHILKADKVSKALNQIFTN